jgi:hypothetical protein
MVTTPGAASSITSTVTVLTVEMLGGFTTLALFPATCFAPVRLGLALARPFRVFDLVAVHLAALPRVGLRVLPPWLGASTSGCSISKSSVRRRSGHIAFLLSRGLGTSRRAGFHL